jgi:ribosomal protein S18 acetylase RimI-like enzyme
VIIVAATEEQDYILIDHYLAIWESYGTPSGDYRPDARQIVREFIQTERSTGGQAGFLAYEGDTCAGSAISGILRSPYPEVLRSEKRLRGYIWSVYVDPIFRRRGIATGLTSRAVDHLWEIGCPSVLLHASDAGRHIYAELGFGQRTRCGSTSE